MKSFLLIAFLLMEFWFVEPVFCMEEVHNVTIRGTTYPVVELLSVKRDMLHRLVFKEYRLLDHPGYSLFVYAKDFEEYKGLDADVKGVPDNRSFSEKHPWYQPTVSTLNLASTIISLF